VGQPGAGLEVADGELDHCVRAVVGVDSDGVAVKVGDEGVVTPVGPQLRLRTDQPGAPHDQPTPRQRRLGDLGDAAIGVVDVDPGGLVDAVDAATTAFVARTVMEKRTL
jgi:hypothetical protein